MRVSVLVISHEGDDRITLHEAEEQAWAELVHYVDEVIAQQPATAAAPEPASEEERVRRFFEAPDASYVLGSADVSEVVAQVDSIFTAAYKSVEKHS